jgi:hypothetical protein
MKRILTFSAESRGGAAAKSTGRQSIGTIRFPRTCAKAISSSQTFDIAESGETTKTTTSAARYKLLESHPPLVFSRYSPHHTERILHGKVEVDQKSLPAKF